MALGKLDRYIIIENFTEAENSYGEPIKTWATYLTCWAEKVDGSGGESISNDQIESKQTIDFRVRYDSGITEEMRVYYNSTYYNIVSIQEERRGRYLLLKSTKVDG